MSKEIRELQAKRHALVEARTEDLKSASAILDAAGEDGLSAEQQTALDSFKASAAKKQAQIKALDEGIALKEELAKAQAAAQPSAAGYYVADGARIEVGEHNLMQDPKRGFSCSGEFFKAVQHAGQKTTRANAIDERLGIIAAAPNTYANESSGADGGYAIPPAFNNSITSFWTNLTAFMQYTDSIEVESNFMAFPKDESMPWSNTGVRAFWEGEAQAVTQTKPVIKRNELRLKKLMALVPMTGELQADAAALTAYLPKKMASAMQWKINEAILFGPGGGLPTGALGSGATVVVPKESGQANKTINSQNVANMVSRLPDDSYPNSIWLINQEALSAIINMQLGTIPIYMPYGTMSAGGIQVTNPYGMLMNRPVIVTQHAAALGSVGDINLVDLSYYQTIKASSGPEMATSMHLYFDADAIAFRTTYRMDGLSKLSEPIVPAKGDPAKPLSPFVQLAAR